MNEVFFSICLVEKFEVLYTIIDHAEFEYGHGNHIRPQNFVNQTLNGTIFRTKRLLFSLLLIGYKYKISKISET